ncbi:hypothetical protein SERLADRAFT_397127 [Serpula lacrymans var. lacrymans S7.9]|uniref:Uncharacterized protein n=1 Tax=Serpula lacrymans var. lacrymans (strain S7.9) TaxID=578457 RepID=F8P587_SERL9|nr:uncharacterized protein SERLADRAFT_397127 [Serpula lacrymans var. lacrymans S7.9]EGO21774.1 hypothetical protein SERLADRAFT_397127 [Serpula lacrymans var. lacrymans S7.9]
MENPSEMVPTPSWRSSPEFCKFNAAASAIEAWDIGVWLEIKTADIDNQSPSNNGRDHQLPAAYRLEQVYIAC